MAGPPDPQCAHARSTNLRCRRRGPRLRSPPCSRPRARRVRWHRRPAPTATKPTGSSLTSTLRKRWIRWRSTAACFASNTRHWASSTQRPPRPWRKSEKLTLYARMNAPCPDAYRAHVAKRAQRLGNHRAAVKSLVRAYFLYSRVPGRSKRLSVISVLAALGEVHRDMGDLASAERLTLEAVRKSEGAGVESHPVGAKARLALAGLRHRQERHTEALEACDEAIVVLRAVRGTDRRDLAPALVRSATVLKVAPWAALSAARADALCVRVTQDLGRIEDALLRLHEALAVQKAALGPESLAGPQSLRRSGICFTYVRSSVGDCIIGHRRFSHSRFVLGALTVQRLGRPRPRTLSASWTKRCECRRVPDGSITWRCSGWATSSGLTAPAYPPEMRCHLTHPYMTAGARAAVQSATVVRGLRGASAEGRRTRNRESVSGTHIEGCRRHAQGARASAASGRMTGRNWHVPRMHMLRRPWAGYQRRSPPTRRALPPCAR
jgi:hypothetical protein